MHKAIAAPLVALTMLFSSFALAAEPDAIVGTWLTTDNDGNRDSVVEIVNENGVYRGTVAWLRYDVYPEGDAMAGQPVVDRENPDEALRKRPIMGITIVEGLKFDDDEWVGGTIYSAREGKTYKAKAELKDADTLKLRGYVGTPLLGKTVIWTRSSVPPAE